MEKLRRFCIVGRDKVGKTTFGLSCFQSEVIHPNRVLYLDTHHSTAPFAVHQYSQAEPWGVKHITKPAEAFALLDWVAGQAARKQYHYDAIVIDDVSDLAMANLEATTTAGDDSYFHPRDWGLHGKTMSTHFRAVDAYRVQAHVIYIARADWVPDPTQKRPQSPDGKFKEDTRDVYLAPLLQGKFGRYFNHAVDGVFYADRQQRGRGYEYSLLLKPKGEVAVAHRWQDLFEKLPERLTDPTFDKLHLLLAGLEEQRVVLGAKVEAKLEGN